MTDLDRNKKATHAMRIVGSPPNGDDETYTASVILEDGIYKLATTKKVNIESLSAAAPNASNYISFEEVSVNDTLTITIQATDASPFFTVVKTVLAGEDRFSFTDRILLELNQDFVNFQPYFKASKVKHNSIIFFEAKNIGEAGENLAVDSFTAVGVGTIALTLQRAFDNWERRSAVIQASKSVDDPRLGIFGIAGTVENRDASVEGLFVKSPYRDNDPALTAMNIDADAGTGNKTFTFPMDTINDIFVSELRFFGKGNGIKFGQFLNIATLSVGILIEIKTDNNMVQLPIIKTTEDFADKFAFGGGDNFQLYVQAGGDKFIASFLSSAFPLRRAGTFGVGNDDYIKITIRDDIDSLIQLEALVIGTLREG